MWKVDDAESGDLTLSSVVSFSPFSGVSVTAVDCVCTSTGLKLACGSENGDIKIFSMSVEHCAAVLTTAVHENLSHGRSVRKLQWKPTSSITGEAVLASCGDDHSVRIFELSNM